VDLTSIMTVLVAVLIVFSGYILFNDMPKLRGSGNRRRR
jgi:hypothetical protein